MRYINFVFLFLSIGLGLQAQSAYEKLFNEAMDLYQKKNYLEARGKFNAARVVSDNPGDGLAEVYLDSATILSFEVLEAARDSIALNEKLATEQLIQTEANRLGLLSSIAYDEEKFDEALILAVEALKLMPDSTSSHIKQAFGEAVKQELSDTIFHSNYFIEQISFCPAEKKLALLTRDSIINIIDLEGALTIYNTSSPVLAMELSSALVLGLLNNTGIIINIGEASKTPLTGHHAALVAVAKNNNGQEFATCGRDSTAILWDRNGNMIKKLSGHLGAVYTAEFASNGQYLLTRSADKTVKIWTINGELEGTLSGDNLYIYDAHFSPDGSLVVAAAADGTASLWDHSGQLLWEMNGHQAAVKTAEFFDNGKQILTRALDNTCRIWTLEGKKVKVLSHDQQVNSVSIEPVGKKILTFSSDGKVRIWDFKGNLVKTYEDHYSAVLGGMGNSTGEIFLTTSTDGKSRLWDIDGNLLMRLDLDRKSPIVSRFTADGEFMITFLNKMVIKTPVPEIALRKVLNKMPYSESRIQEIKRKHQIKTFANTTRQ